MSFPETSPPMTARGRLHRSVVLAAGLALALAVVGIPGRAAAQTILLTTRDPVTDCPFPVLTPAALTPERDVALDARLARLRERAAIPGISAAVLFPDGSRWTGTDGLADVGMGTPVTPDTAFAIASISKTFTAALILSLRDTGRIDLEAPVRRYLPDIGIDASITVHELLDHTSGLRDFFFDPRIDAALQGQPARVWDAARSLRYVGKPYFKPGAGWHYSNTNYLLLGLIAERVGRAPLADQLQAAFFDPLGLEHTYEQIRQAPHGPTAHGYHFAVADSNDTPIDLADGTTSIMPFRSVITAAGAAGSIASTPDDLVRWASDLYGGQVLQPRSLTEMVGDVALTAPDHPAIPYGLGVQAVDLDGHPALGHSGRLLGFRSVVRYLPAERIAIAVVSNQSRTDLGSIAASLLHLAMSPVSRCLIGPAPAILAPRPPVEGSPQPEYLRLR